MKISAEEFIREKEHEVENLFRDWHIEKLASVMEAYHKAMVQNYSNHSAEEIRKEFKEKLPYWDGYHFEKSKVPEQIYAYIEWLEAKLQEYAAKGSEPCDRCKKLEFMIDNGLGWDDMQNDRQPKQQVSDPDHKELLRETALRANLIMPTDDTELKWFDEGTAKSGDFATRLYEALDVVDKQQVGENGCTCQGCGVKYNIDLVIPDALWEKITPKQIEGDKSGGLLCGSCIMKRLEKLTGENADYWYFTKEQQVSDDHIVDPNKMVSDAEIEEAANNYANSIPESCEYDCSVIEDAFKAGYNLRNKQL